MVIGYIGGGVALAGGIAMILLSRASSSERGPTASIVPTDGGAMAFGSLQF
jgi:hypothetical protein